MFNFNSAYNTGANLGYQPTIYRPISSSASFSSQPTRSNLKFSFDLYNPNEYSSESFDYLSPSDSVIIHHHPVYSPSPSQAISKLRQVNDDLCYTLAQCDLNSQPQPSLPPPLSPQHYHVHHYPIPRSPSPKEEDSSSTESEPIPKKRNARITYKAHIPRRKTPLDTVDQLLLSTSDAYPLEEPMTVDLYPTRDQGFVRRIRNRPDNQSPWLADTSPVRRNSYSETSTYRTPRAPDYDNKPIEPNSRLASGKRVRPRSSSVKSRVHRSADVFSSTGPVWRPSGSIKNPKFIGSHAPPSKPKASSEPVWNPGGSTKIKQFRALDPAGLKQSKTYEPVWHPASKTKPKHPKYFEPSIKPELIAPVPKQTTRLIPKKSTIRSGDPQLKARIANVESKVQNKWDEPPATRTKPKPPIVPRPTTTTTTTTKPKLTSAPVKKVVSPPSALINTDTGRSSLNDVPSKPLFQSTPRNRSIDQGADDLFEVESQASEPSQKLTMPHPPPQVELTPTKAPKTTVPEPDQGTKATIKDGVLVHGDDIDNRASSPDVNNRDDEEEEEEEPKSDQTASPSPIPPPRKEPSPKPDNRDDASVVDDEDINQSHEDTAQNSALDDTVKDTDAPSMPKADNKTSPNQKESSSLHETSRQSSVHAEKNPSQPPSTPPPAPVSGTHDAADDFFDN